MSRSFSFSCNAASRWAMATLRSSASASFSAETFSMIDIVSMSFCLRSSGSDVKSSERIMRNWLLKSSVNRQQKSRFLSSPQRSIHNAWSHLLPVQAVEKNRELRSTQRNHAVLDRGPNEAASLKSLRIQNQTRAVPGEDFDSIASLRAEHKKIATERIAAQCVRHQHRQRIHSAPEVYRARGHQYAKTRTDRYHRVLPAAKNTSRKTERSTSPLIRMRTSPSSTSISQASFATGTAGVSPATTMGTNAGPPRTLLSAFFVASAACRRHKNRRLGLMS